MDIDEEKGLRLRKSQLEAELNRINQLLHDQAVVDFEAERAERDLPIMPKPHREVANRRNPLGYPANKYSKWAPKSAKGTDREQFYKDAENDFRNSDSNGNYSG